MTNSIKHISMNKPERMTTLAVRNYTNCFFKNLYKNIMGNVQDFLVFNKGQPHSCLEAIPQILFRMANQHMNNIHCFQCHEFLSEKVDLYYYIPNTVILNRPAHMHILFKILRFKTLDKIQCKKLNFKYYVFVV